MYTHAHVCIHLYTYRDEICTSRHTCRNTEISTNFICNKLVSSYLDLLIQCCVGNEAIKVDFIESFSSMIITATDLLQIYIQ